MLGDLAANAGQYLETNSWLAMLAVFLGGVLMVSSLCVLAMILFQFVINIGMNLSILPVAGLPLPFISYGSTALLTTLIGVGIAENVVMRHKRFEF